MRRKGSCAVVQEHNDGVANFIMQIGRFIIGGRQLDERRTIELITCLIQCF